MVKRSIYSKIFSFNSFNELHKNLGGVRSRAELLNHKLHTKFCLFISVVTYHLRGTVIWVLGQIQNGVT